MRGPERFRRELAARVAKILGASVALTGCEGGYGGVVWTGGDTGGSTTTLAASGGTSPASSSSSGAGGAGGSDGGTTSVSSSSSSSSSAATTTGGQGAFTGIACFPWTGVCPVEPDKALDQFMALPCPSSGPTSGYEPTAIIQGPTAQSNSMKCCYDVDLVSCGLSGRPLILDGAPLLAGIAADITEWSRPRAARAASTVDVSSLSASDREALAAAWAADGLAEHASIASFSRVALELMSFNAPADLVARCHAAALDEVRHATLCFSLASAYAGAPIGPSALPLPTALPLASSLEEIAVGAVVEGCLGETIAASLAAEQLAQATDPAVRDALAQIANDEARHAELAYRIVAWAIAAGGDDVRRAVARAFADALCAPTTPTTSAPHRVSLTAHGRLSGSEASAARARAMREVIVPAVRAPRAATMAACLPTT